MIVKAVNLRTVAARIGVVVVLACLSALLGCQKADQPETTSTSQSTATPGSAPQAQPRYGQTGTSTSSRVLTNGQQGLSTRETTQDSNSNSTAPSSDEALSQRVLVALSTGTTGTSGTYSADRLLPITVTASNGVVTLQGAVGTEQAKRAFEERTKDMDGVRAVVNELQISPGAPDRPGLPAGRAVNEAAPPRR